MSATANAVSVVVGIAQPPAKRARRQREVERRRERHAAERRGEGQRRRAPRSEPPDGELALDLEPHHEEEDAEQAVVDPGADRQPQLPRARREGEGRLPERLELRPEGRVDDGDRRQRHQEKREAGRRRPAREAERGGLNAVPEGAHRGLGERVFVPGALVAPAVDEEGGRAHRPVAARAFHIVLHALARAARGLLVAARQREPRRERVEVLRRAAPRRASSARRASPRTGPRTRAHTRRARPRVAPADRR